MPLDGTLNTSRKPQLRSGQRVIAWAAQALADMDQAQPTLDDGWTPARAGEQLVAAMKWARFAAGRVGPAGIRSGQPAYMPTDDEYFEDFGLREVADPEDVPPMRIQPSPAQISRHEAALQWPAIYLVGEGREGSAKMVGLWAACKAYRRPFASAVKERGIPRGLAYQLRDRGLSLISQSLARDGVKPEV